MQVQIHSGILACLWTSDALSGFTVFLEVHSCSLTYLRPDGLLMVSRAAGFPGKCRTQSKVPAVIMVLGSLLLRHLLVAVGWCDQGWDWCSLACDGPADDVRLLSSMTICRD